jgi:carboxyl-terminal processing protease
VILDYKEGIIRYKQTYGKGTVQNVIDLNQFVRNGDVGDLGALKTTTQKFYRINDPIYQSSDACPHQV